MSEDNPFNILSTKIMYENPWMLVREDEVIRPDGSKGTYGIMESKDSIVVIALNIKHEVYLIRAYSYPAQAWSWTLPGGSTDGENATTAANRELAEETGIVSESLRFLGKTRIAGGIITEKTSFFLALGLTQKQRAYADDKDLVKGGKFVSLKNIDKMIVSGEIDDCQTITGIFFAHKWLSNNR